VCVNQLLGRDDKTSRFAMQLLKGCSWRFLCVLCVSAMRGSPHPPLPGLFAILSERRAC